MDGRNNGQRALLPYGNNVVKLRGPITHICYFKDNRSCAVTIATEVTRYRKTKEGKYEIFGTSCFPTVNFFDEKAETIHRAFKKGDYVDIIADVRAYLNKKGRPEQALHGNSCAASDKILSVYYDGYGKGPKAPRGTKSPTCVATFRGTILNIRKVASLSNKKEPLAYNILLDTTGPGSRSKIVVTYYTTSKNKLPCELKKGLKICCQGHIETRKVAKLDLFHKKSSDEYAYYENTVVDEIDLWDGEEQAVNA